MCFIYANDVLKNKPMYMYVHDGFHKFEFLYSLHRDNNGNFQNLAPNTPLSRK